MKKHLIIFGMIASAIITTAAYKDARYKKLLDQASVIQATVDNLIGAKPSDLVLTLGQPTEKTKWGDDENPLLVYKIDQNSKLNVYVANERVVRSLLIITSN